MLKKVSPRRPSYIALSVVLDAYEESCRHRTPYVFHVDFNNIDNNGSKPCNGMFEDVGVKIIFEFIKSFSTLVNLYLATIDLQHNT